MANEKTIELNTEPLDGKEVWHMTSFPKKVHCWRPRSGWGGLAAPAIHPPQGERK